MTLRTHEDAAIDLLATPVHLGLGSRAYPVEGFAFEPEALDAYSAAVAADGAEGRLVMVFDGDSSWTSWERHPAGDELVLCVEGRATLIQERDGGHHAVDLRPGQAVINPAGVWHTADIDGPVRILTVTPGLGTEHRPR